MFFVDNDPGCGSSDDVPMPEDTDEEELTSEQDVEPGSRERTRKKVLHQNSPPKALISSRSKLSAWVDPADTQPAKVSLLNGPSRLRKLRQAVDENEITGREYETRLRSQFERINPEPAWARKARGKKNIKVDEDEDDEPREDIEEESGEGIQRLLTSTIGVLTKNKNIGKRVVLPQGSLAVERVRDANHSTQSSSSGEVRVVSFHPKHAVPVLCVATADRRIRLFHVGWTYFPSGCYLIYHKISG